MITIIAATPEYNGKLILTLKLKGSRKAMRGYSDEHMKQIATNWVMRRYRETRMHIEWESIQLRLSDAHVDYFIRDLWALKVSWTTHYRAQHNASRG